MTDTPRPWDRLTAESDPAFEAFAANLHKPDLNGVLALADDELD